MRGRCVRMQDQVAPCTCIRLGVSGVVAASSERIEHDGELCGDAGHGVVPGACIRFGATSVVEASQRDALPRCGVADFASESPKEE